MPYHKAADGTRLFVKDWGAGPTVVFVHAWSLDSTMWEYQFQAFLEAGFRCVAMDRRGHGRSEVPGHGYDLDTLADDLAGVLERLDLHDVTLVAHSMGTLEAGRHLGRQGGGRVGRAAFLGAMTPMLTRSHDNPHGIPAGYTEGVLADLRTDRPGWFHAAAPGYFATAGPPVSEAVVGDGIRQILATPLEVQVRCLRTVFGADLRADLAAVDVPTLVMHGDADRSAPIELTGRPTAALLRGSRLDVLPGEGHGLYVTAKDRVTAELLAFAKG
ncbi:MAG: alpha/beta fold hydrolase [Pseudonocardia sp.]